MRHNFLYWTGDTFGLPTDSNHLNFLWLEKGTRVLFSVARQGNGASCHFSSDRNGLVKIDRAIEEFIAFVFDVFDWCEMILAKVKLKSVMRIVEQHCFKKVHESSFGAVYVRRK